MISAKIICDSINPAGVRLTTFELVYPRFIHSEFMTHRAISKNSASSRAIPIEKMLDAVDSAPAMPEFWAQNQKGMQAIEELEQPYKTDAQRTWLEARDSAVRHAWNLKGISVHKAIANRIVEPWMHMTVVATGDQCGWANLFSLRAHPAAQQEFQVLAFRMLNQYVQETPERLAWSAWHLPYIEEIDRWTDCDKEGVGPCGDPRAISDLLKISTARCARVSYTNQGKIMAFEDDVKRHDELRDQRPVHASAFEHCAQARPILEDDQGYVVDRNGDFSNFHPTWLQYRKLIPHESTRTLDLKATLAAKPDWITL